MTPPLLLGAFRLVRPIDEGGMSQVWGGLHAESEVPVAVKVMTGGAAWDPSFRTMFRNEVRAVARLNHPGIIAVLDHGEVPADVAAASNGELVAGSPYLVMEYAGGSALGKRRRRWSWAALRRLLLAVIDALGHAHARGVVHRDIKPGNVLLAGPDDVRGGIKLTDFGIAWVGGEQAHTMAGTLQYMAPEQHAGDWVAYGPGTDLYALACVAWRIVAGQTPFAHHAGRAVARAHLFEAPPALVPRFQVPDGFDAWLRVLLHKDPQARPACAADARELLVALGQVDDDRAAEDLGLAAQDDVPLSVASGRSGDEVAPVPPGAGDPAGAEVAPDGIAALPASWQADTERVPLSLRGAGLGLFELRELPLVGRVRERDLLWKGLQATVESGTPRVAVVRGAAGVGKTRLVEWVAQRAHETAGVDTLWITGDGVREGVSSFLGVDRLEDDQDREDVLTEKLKHCADADLLVPTLLQALDVDGGLEPHVFTAAVRRLLEWRSAQRPVLVVLDDAHGADLAFELLRDLLDEPWDVPLSTLCLMVVRDENLVEIPGAEERITSVLKVADKPKVISLGPLDQDARPALLRDLGLSPSLAARVDERTEGNPLFAVQLVGDWIQRDLLELGPDGFTLKVDANVAVPHDLTEVWSARVKKLLQPLPVVATIHLERAAALGLHLDRSEWDRVCDDPRRGGVSEAGQQIRASLVEAMLDARLAEERAAGWAFVHPMLRETIANNSRTAKRWEGHHRAIVEMLQAVEGSDPGRIGLHLIEAGEVAEAVDPLLLAFPQRLRQRGVTAASAVYLPLKQAMEHADLPADDVRWAVLWRYQSQLIRHQGNPEDARPWAERAREIADAAGDDEEWARCGFELAGVMEQCGLIEDGLWVLQKAAARLLRARRKGQVLAQVLSRMALMARMMNQLDDADRWSSQCAAILERAEFADADLQGNNLVEMGVIAARRGELERALELYEEAEPLLSDAHAHSTIANLENNRGNVLKDLGRWEEAEARFEAAADAYTAMGYDAFIPRLNLILCRMKQSRHVEAAQMADALLQQRSTSRVNHALALLSRAVCDAARFDWAGFQRRYHPAVEALRNARFVDPDVVFLLQHAAGYAEHAVQIDAACALWFFVREQAAAMSDEELVEHATLALEELSMAETDLGPS